MMPKTELTGGLIAKGHEGTWESWKNVTYLDYGDGKTSVYIFKIHQVVYLK